MGKWLLPPWGGVSSVIQCVLEGLKNDGYSIGHWNQDIPFFRQEKSRDRIFKILDLLESTPDLLLATNSREFGHIISEMVPILWALHTHKYVHTVDTPTLVRALSWSGDGIDVEREHLKSRVETAQLLVWKDIEITYRHFHDNPAAVMALFGRRARLSRIIKGSGRNLLIACYDRTFSMDAVEGLLHDALGDSLTMMIMQTFKICKAHFRLRAPKEVEL